MSADPEIERLRQHWHELRVAVDATAITVAVIQERQSAHSEQMDRIEASVLTCADLLRQQNGRLRTAETDIAVLKDRDTRDQRKSVAWGGGSAAAIVAVVEAVKAYFK